MGNPRLGIGELNVPRVDLELVNDHAELIEDQTYWNSCISTPLNPSFPKASSHRHAVREGSRRSPSPRKGKITLAATTNVDISSSSAYHLALATPLVTAGPHMFAT